MEVDKADTCKEMVINGLGHGILPNVLTENYQHLHQINLTDEQGNPLTRSTWMLYHQESFKSNVIKEFVQFVRKLDFKHLNILS